MNHLGTISRRVPALCATAVTVIVIMLSYAFYANAPIIQHDLSTYLLPAAAHELGYGSPYASFFDVKPPLTFAVFVPWVSVFGKSLLGIWVFYGMWLAALFAGFWLALRRMVDAWLALAVFASAGVVIVGSGLLEGPFFATETVGLVLVLGAVLLLTSGLTSPWCLVTSGLLLGAAGQVKDVFIFAPLALLPVIVSSRQGSLKRLAFAAVGLVLALVGTAGILLAWGGGALGAYGEALAYKRERFPAPSPDLIGHNLVTLSGFLRSWLPLGILLVLVPLVLLVRLLIRQRNVREVMGRAIRSPHATVLALLVAVLVGFTWQGGGPVYPYGLALLVPLYLMLGALMSVSVRLATAKSPRARWVVLGLVLLAVVPSASSLGWTAGRFVAFSPAGLVDSARALESAEELLPYEEVRELAPLESCIHAIHGWAASAYYLYAERRPCSRFVVPPLPIGRAMDAELTAALLAHPPAVFVNDEAVRYLAASSGNSGVGALGAPSFPFEAVVQMCYEPVSSSPILFVPSFASDEAVRLCMERQIEATDSS